MDKKHCLWRPIESGTIKLEKATKTYVCCFCGRQTTVPDGVDVQEHLSTQPFCNIRCEIPIESTSNSESISEPCPEPPSLLKKGLKYAKATTRWIAAGRPARTENEIARIFDKICSPCEFFNQCHQTCTVCGCRIRKDSKALTNKIAMATERCPKGRW